MLMADGISMIANEILKYLQSYLSGISTKNVLVSSVLAEN